MFQSLKGRVLLAQILQLLLELVGDVGEVFERVAARQHAFIQAQAQLLGAFHRLARRFQGGRPMLQSFVGDFDDVFSDFLDDGGFLLFGDVGLAAVFRDKTQARAQRQRRQSPAAGWRQVIRKNLARVQFGGEAGGIGHKQSAPAFDRAGGGQFQGGAETFLQILAFIQAARGLAQGAAPQPTTHEPTENAKNSDYPGHIGHDDWHGGEFICDYGHEPNSGPKKESMP